MKCENCDGSLRVRLISTGGQNDKKKKKNLLLKREDRREWPEGQSVSGLTQVKERRNHRALEPKTTVSQ